MSKFATTAWNHLLDLGPRQESATRRLAAPARSSLMRRLLRTLAAWQERAATRDDLRHLPDWMLRDIGLTRHATLSEARRPFWQE